MGGRCHREGSLKYKDVIFYQQQQVSPIVKVWVDKQILYSGSFAQLELVDKRAEDSLSYRNEQKLLR